jgi:branched-chain amino acid transport system substrate-binding protein
MNRSKLVRAAALLVLLVALVAGCAPQATPTPAGPKVITFGAAVEMTGSKATEGKVLKDGMDFWKDWVNSHGGIQVGGETYNVDIIYYDDESDEQTAAKLTEKLITEDGTKFLLGPFSSAITIATAAIGEKYGAITVAPLANSGQIYSQGYRYVFSVLPPAANYLRLMIEMAVTEFDPKPTTAAILALDDPFGISCAEGTKMWADQSGLDVVLYEKYPSDTKDLSSLLTKVKGLNPDLVLASSLFEHAALITRQAKELDFCPKLLGFTVGPTFPDFITSLGPDAEYVMGSEWWLPNMGWKCPIFGDSMNYAQLFEEKYGYTPDYHAAAGTAAGVIYQFAFENAGTLDVEAVRDAIAALDVEFFWGPQAFSENGENRKGGSGPIQIQNGKHVAIYPAELQQAPPVYPFVCWDER